MAKLRAAIDRQAIALSRGIRLHAVLCPADMRTFHQTLERFFRQSFADELVRLKLDPAGPAPSDARPELTGLSSLSNSVTSLPSPSAGQASGSLLRSHTQHLLRDLQHGGSLFAAAPMDHLTASLDPALSLAAETSATTAVDLASAPTSQPASTHPTSKSTSQPIRQHLKGASSSTTTTTRNTARHSARPMERTASSTHTVPTLGSYDDDISTGSAFEEMPTQLSTSVPAPMAVPPSHLANGTAGASANHVPVSTALYGHPSASTSSALAPEPSLATEQTAQAATHTGAHAHLPRARSGNTPPSAAKLWTGSSNRFSKLVMGRAKK